MSSSLYRETSPESPAYNCIAWVAEETTRWWWPDAFFLAYWPPGVPREETVDAMAQAYGTLGYSECKEAGVESGFEKIAIYAVDGRPKHAARQLPDGSWTSKLGQGVDIEHALEGLESELYGQVAKIMRRRRP